MNRTRLCETVSVDAGVTAGEVLVATSIRHPRRGPVDCPAAALVAGSLHRLGIPTRYAPLRIGGSGATAVVLSYLDRSGRATGLAVAVPSYDEVALRAAAELVAEWAATLCTRRILVDDGSPGCAGDLCPLVSAAHDELRQRVNDGDTVMIVGREGHAVLPGLRGQSARPTPLVQTAEEVAALPFTDDGSLSYVVQPGVPVAEAMRVAAALRERFPGIRGPRPQYFCYAPDDRIDTVRALAEPADLVLVRGAARAPDTGELMDLASRFTQRPRWVADLGDIRPEWLAGAASVAVLTSPSAPPTAPDDMVAGLGGLGPSTVVRRSVRTQVSGAFEDVPETAEPVPLLT